LRSTGLTTLVVIAGTLTGLPPAAAQEPCSGDTTGATLDQYCETVPTAGGRQGAADEPGESRMPSSDRSIPDRTATTLRQTSLGRILAGPEPSPVSGKPADGRSPARSHAAGGGTPDDASRQPPDGRDVDGSTPSGTVDSVAKFRARDALAGVPLGALAAVVLLVAAAAAAGAARARRGRSA